jgi:broad specificity phosphatase PhoE
MRSVARGLSGLDAIFSSPARRCADLARELAAQRGLPLELMPELGERRFGAWENRFAAQIPIAELTQFWKDPVGFTPPRAEPFDVLRDRVLRGWNLVLERQTRFALLITHGGVIRIILGQVLDIPADALLRIEVPPACRTRLRVPVGEGRPSLMCHGGLTQCGAPS